MNEIRCPSCSTLWAFDGGVLLRACGCSEQTRAAAAQRQRQAQRTAARRRTTGREAMLTLINKRRDGLD